MGSVKRLGEKTELSTTERGSTRLSLFVLTISRLSLQSYHIILEKDRNLETVILTTTSINHQKARYAMSKQRKETYDGKSVRVGQRQRH